jgi:S-phase kinase-associated protein 1
MCTDQEDDSSEMLEIPLPRVRSEILAKVIEYCQHYQEEPMTEIAKPLKANKMEEVVQDWYAKFVVDLSPDDLKSYITAANYMCIKPMQNLSCAMVAFMIKAKIPEEIANLPYE